MFEKKTPAVEKRGVHLDLKGMPPTFAYLLRIVDLLSALRINFILLEVEDMFPWRKHPELKSKNAYSVSQMKEFYSKCRRKNIQVIPLVQSYGHLGNILARKNFANLREIGDDPNVVCPLKGGARDVIADMLNEVIDVFPGIQYFHLGGDEASSLGACRRCRRYVKKYGRSKLYMEQLTPLIDVVAAKNIRPIIWCDMVVNWSEEEIAGIAARCDLMLWRYGLNDDYQLNFTYNFDPVKTRKAHAALWGAGAYRCAGEGGIAPNLIRRAENMKQWVGKCKEFGLKGLVATGWSRGSYLELSYGPLDNALTSMALCAKVMWDGKYEIVSDISKVHKFLGRYLDKRLSDLNNRFLVVSEHLERACPETITTGRGLAEDLPVNTARLRQMLKLFKDDFKELAEIEKRYKNVLRGKAFPSEITYWMAALRKKYSDIFEGPRKTANNLLNKKPPKR